MNIRAPQFVPVAGRAADKRPVARLYATRQVPLTRPRWDLLRLATVAVLSCYVWRLQDVFPILTAMKASLLASLAAIALFLMSPAAIRELRRARHPVVKWAVALFIMMIISVPTSLWQGRSFSFILNDHSKTLIMMLLVVSSIRAFADVERYAIAHVLGGAIYSAIVLTRIQIGQGGRLNDLYYYDANDLGMLLVATLPMVLYFTRRSAPTAIRLLALFIAGLYLLTIVKSGSRGAFLGLIAVAIFVLLTFTSLPSRVRIGWVIGGVFLLSVWGSAQYWTQMKTLLNPQDDYNWVGKEDTGRMEIWKRGIGYMLSHPVTGVGVQAFPIAEGTISPLAARQSLGRGLKWSAAHNAFVQIGAELGIPGLIAFVAMLIAAFRCLMPIRRQRSRDAPERKAQAAMAQALQASLIGFAVTAFFLSQGYAAYLYALLGLIAGFAAITSVRRAAATVEGVSSPKLARLGGR
jgi:O-antigen ligase